jgi:acyl carrier protein
MTHVEIHKKLNSVFRDVFDNPGLDVSESTTAKDIEGWDSLIHVNLVVAVEKAFGVRFTTKDIKSLDNVGAWMKLIEKRLG